VMSEIRFESSEQRSSFGAALTEAVREVIGRYTSPNQTSPGKSPPYRFILGCYPIPFDAPPETAD
jgi:hypothetical protein